MATTSHFPQVTTRSGSWLATLGSVAALAALAGCLTLGLAGCGETSSSNGGSNASSSSQSSEAESGISSLSVLTKADGSDSSLLDGEVALSVNGTLVYEQDVTAYIQAQREKNGLSGDDDWASYLADAGQDGSSIRDKALERYIDTILLDEAISERGLSVSSEEVSESLSQMRDYYNSYGDNGWEQVRNAMGYSSDEAFSSHMARQMLLQKLKESVTGGIVVSDEEVQAYLEQHADEYAGKRAALIILPDLESAEQVKELIDSGAMTFQEAALTYSLAYSNAYTTAYAASMSSAASDTGDSSSTGTTGGTDIQQLDGTTGSEATVASNAEDAQAAVDTEKALYVSDDAWQSALDTAGDCGWQSTSDIEAAADSSSMGGVAVSALADLEAGEVSDPIETLMGVQLIMCTESYDPETDGTQLSDLPEDLQEQVRSDALEQAKKDAWNAFGEQLFSSAEIDVTSMPAGLPYDVDVPETADASAASDVVAVSADSESTDGEVGGSSRAE